MCRYIIYMQINHYIKYLLLADGPIKTKMIMIDHNRYEHRILISYKCLYVIIIYVHKHNFTTTIISSIAHIHSNTHHVNLSISIGPIETLFGIRLTRTSALLFMLSLHTSKIVSKRWFEIQ